MSTHNQELKLIYDDYANCTRCRLSETRLNKPVFGTGNRNAAIMLISDAPSASEERLGHHNTQDIRWIANIFRRAIGQKDMPIGASADLFFQNFFMTSSVLCRPTVFGSDDYRKPDWKKEVQMCYDRLTATIYAVDPLVVISAGEFATKALLQRTSGLPKRRGTLDSSFNFSVPGVLSDVMYTAIPTVDYSMAIRRGDYDDPNGTVSAFARALSSAWAIKDKLMKEDT